MAHHMTGNYTRLYQRRQYVYFITVIIVSLCLTRGYKGVSQGCKPRVYMPVAALTSSRNALQISSQNQYGKQHNKPAQCVLLVLFMLSVGYTELFSLRVHVTLTCLTADLKSDRIAA